jgi:hypothetical protein
MPLAWIHQLSKQQLENMASQLGLSADGSLDELRKRVKERWTTIEPYLPPALSAKFDTDMNSVRDSIEPAVLQESVVSKIRLNMVKELISSVPVVSGTEPEVILNFLIRVRQIYVLKLISDSEFIMLLVSRTSGRLLNVLSAHLGPSYSWGMVQDVLVASFLPLRVKETFMTSYVLQRFQRADEDMNSFIASVVEAAAVLGFPGSESQLVRRMIQNLHPRVKSHFVFENRPESIQELFSLATTVAEAVAVDDQRKSLAVHEPRQLVSRNTPNRILAVETDRRVCWKCGVSGHLRRDCTIRRSQRTNPLNSGNANGARRLMTRSERPC